MANPCKDLRRRCIPLGEWPLPDRKAWASATAAGSALSNAGLAAAWSDGHRDRVIQSYGRFLGFLGYQGTLDASAAPADRVSRETVIAYATALQRQCALVTVHGYVLHLQRALAALAPDVDWHWLSRLAARLGARARPSRDKRRRVVPIEALYDLGLRLMDGASGGANQTDESAAVQFRDGLMVALLSQRMLRRRSFINLTLGRHISRTDQGYHIALAAADTKNRRSYEAPIPDVLTRYMDMYLDQVRPLLLGERVSDRLWISRAGTDLADDSFYGRIRTVTARELGRPINPHLFRDCATTSRAIDDPDHIRSMQPLLGHSSMAPSEMHYNHAKAIEAARDYQALINRKRQRVRRKCK